MPVLVRCSASGLASSEITVDDDDGISVLIHGDTSALSEFKKALSRGAWYQARRPGVLFGLDIEIILTFDLPTNGSDTPQDRESCSRISLWRRSRGHLPQVSRAAVRLSAPFFGE